MSKELERLRSESKALESLMGRHLGSTPLAAIQADVSNRIEKLEAEAADPWREAKCVADEWIHGFNPDTRHGQVAHYTLHLEAENARLTARVAELESEFTPAVLKRADEIRPGDMIVANGKIRLVTETARHAVQYRVQISCDDWGSWFDPSDLFAVLRKPLVEPCPLVENPKLPEPPQPRFGARP